MFEGEVRAEAALPADAAVFAGLAGQPVDVFRYYEDDLVKLYHGDNREWFIRQAQVGVVDMPTFDTAALDPGDSLVLFTDGISEARAPGGEFFGEAGLERALTRLPPCTDARSIVQAICDALADPNQAAAYNRDPGTRDLFGADAPISTGSSPAQAPANPR